MKRTLLSFLFALAALSQVLAGTITANTGTPAGTTAFVIGTIPANCVIYAYTLANTTANAITGGVNIGTAGSVSTIASALAVGANATVFTSFAPTPSNSSTLLVAEPVAIQIAAVTAWNSASLNMSFTYACY